MPIVPALSANRIKNVKCFRALVNSSGFGSANRNVRLAPFRGLFGPRKVDSVSIVQACRRPGTR